LLCVIDKYREGADGESDEGRGRKRAERIEKARKIEK